MKKPHSYWTFERCKQDALLYTSKTEWRTANTSYKAAQRHGWIGDQSQCIAKCMDFLSYER